MSRNEDQQPDKQSEHAPRPDAEHTPDKNRPQSSSGDAESLDFVVTEAHDSSPELIGGYADEESPDDLGLQSNADLLTPGHEVAAPPPDEDSAGDSAEPIGSSAPPLPTGMEENYESDQADFGDVKVSEDNLTPPDGPDRIEKLSDEQVEEISRRMQSSDQSQEYLSESEKMRLLNDLDSIESKSKGFDNAPIVPPKKSTAKKEAQEAPAAQIAPTPPPPTATPKPPVTSEDSSPQPKMAARSRGVAEFAGRYIRIVGEQELHEDDEVTIGGRDYLLKKWKATTKTIVAVAAPVAVLLIVLVTTVFLPDADTGEGQIIGLALDEYGQPMITGAEVHFPDLGETYRTNAQGFFKTDAIPTGSQKIEYVMAGMVVATDYATVTSDDITTLTLSPEEPVAEETVSEPVASAPVQTEPAQTASKKPAAEPAGKKSSKKASGQTASKKKSRSRKKSTPASARLKLAANVDNAKLKIDGSVLGAGNLTYSKIKPGTHGYVVSKKGYQDATGSIKLVGGKTKTLSVELEPEEREPTAEDYAQMGRDAARSDDLQMAMQHLNTAISMQPSFAGAYAQRAAVEESLGDAAAARDDYVKAAEIYRIRQNYNESATAYAEALRIDDRSLTAYLGRGSLYLDRGEDIAAVADFDMVVRMDKRNLQGYLGLGRARYNLGYYKKATKHFKDARSLAPEKPEVYRYLMLSYLGEGKFDDVRKSYEKYLEYASVEDQRELQSDPKFTAVLQMVDSDK